MMIVRPPHECPIRRGMVIGSDFVTGAFNAIRQRRYPIDSDVFDCHYLGRTGHPDFVDSDHPFCIDSSGIGDWTCHG